MSEIAATAQVLEKSILAPGVFTLRLERHSMVFQTGQYVSVGLPDQRKQREYSIFSGEHDADLQILVKEVPDGQISHRLATLEIGSVVTITGPYGYFLLEASLRAGVPLLWIATGTGISPFRSFVRTYPQADYRLLHGVRTVVESGLSAEFDPKRVVTCVSGQAGGAFRGRVTTYLASQELDPQTHVFLCGNCDMIYDAFDLLQAKGIPSGQIFTEVYY